MVNRQLCPAQCIGPMQEQHNDDDGNGNDNDNDVDNAFGDHNDSNDKNDVNNSMTATIIMAFTTMMS